MHWREGKRNPKKMVKRCPNFTELPHFWKTAFLDCTQRDKTPEECFKEEDEMDTLFNIFKPNSEICINGREIIDKLMISIQKTQRLRINQLLGPWKRKDYARKQMYPVWLSCH